MSRQRDGKLRRAITALIWEAVEEGIEMGIEQERERAVGECNDLVSRISFRPMPIDARIAAYERGKVRAAEDIAAAIKEAANDHV